MYYPHEITIRLGGTEEQARRFRQRLAELGLDDLIAAAGGGEVKAVSVLRETWRIEEGGDEASS